METDSNYVDMTDDDGNKYYTQLDENPPPKPPQIRVSILSHTVLRSWLQYQRSRI